MGPCGTCLTGPSSCLLASSRRLQHSRRHSRPEPAKPKGLKARLRGTASRQAAMAAQQAEQAAQQAGSGARDSSRSLGHWPLRLSRRPRAPPGPETGPSGTRLRSRRVTRDFSGRQSQGTRGSSSESPALRVASLRVRALLPSQMLAAPAPAPASGPPSDASATWPLQHCRAENT